MQRRPPRAPRRAVPALRAAALALAAALAGCGGGAGGPAAENRAPGVARGAQGEDGLIVGHRLMAAGEHELALKAYLRAAAEVGINADVLSAIGSANLSLGRLGQAEQMLRRAIEQDPAFVPALNNLGVVLMERNQAGEARQVFQQAFALDSGQSDSIRKNLQLAIAATEQNVYPARQEKSGFSLVRRDKGQYVLLTQL